MRKKMKLIWIMWQMSWSRGYLIHSFCSYYREPQSKSVGQSLGIGSVRNNSGKERERDREIVRFNVVSKDLSE